MNSKKDRRRIKYVILVGSILLPYALSGQNLIDIVYADMTEDIVIVDGKRIKKYTTSDWREVPEYVKNNPDFYHFIDDLGQQAQIGIVTKDQAEAEGQLNFQNIVKEDDYTLSDVIKGLAPDTDHYVILPEALVGNHSQLGLTTLNDLREQYEGLNSAIRLQQSSSGTKHLTGEYLDLPTYVRENPDPIFDYKLKITEGPTQYTTNKTLAQGQPNFVTAPFTAEDLEKAIPGKADADKLASGELTQLPDKFFPLKSYTTAEHNQNLLDMKNGLVTLGSVNATVTPEQETDNLTEAELHDSYRIEGNKPVGQPQETQPEGELNVDYKLTEDFYLPEWQTENVTSKPKAGVDYDDVADYDEKLSQARFWGKNSVSRTDVTLEKLQEDFDAGLIIRDSTGKHVTSISELSLSVTTKIITPYDFDPDNLINDFPQAFDELNPTVDLLPGNHLKHKFAALPTEVGNNFAKKTVYIKDLYTGEGKLDKSKLVGEEGIDWKYDHVFETNGSKKLVVLANLHLPGHKESLANENTPLEEGRVYEYWELNPKTKQYEKTQWKYLLSEIPDSIAYHKHELSSLQDAYNNGVGTATTWYQLKGTANFENNVNNSIKTGNGNAGGIDSWAYLMMGFRPVKNTDESELLKQDVNNKNIIADGHISKDKLLYRTTILQYGLTNLNTPSDEIINDHIYMELIPYINPDTGVQAVDKNNEPVFTWNKFYYTDIEEYYALERISAYDYGYHVEDDNKYTYTVAEPQYQTREKLPYYQKIVPVYAYTDNLYSYDMKKHAYLPTKYAYREDTLSWEYYELMAYQPSYQEKLYTPWYSYDLPEIRKYSWQIVIDESDTEDNSSTDSGDGSTTEPGDGSTTDTQDNSSAEIGNSPSTETKASPSTNKSDKSPNVKNQNILPKTGSLNSSILSLIGAISLAILPVVWQKYKKIKK